MKCDVCDVERIRTVKRRVEYECPECNEIVYREVEFDNETN